MDTRGTATMETLVLWAAVAVAGAVGMTTLGSSMDRAVAGDADGSADAAQVGATSDAMVSSRQAGAVTSVDRFIEQAVMSAREGAASARAVEHFALSTPARVREAGVAPIGFSRSTVRVGIPEYLHEAEQALRYGDLRGGGVYLFSSKKLGSEGIDGIFSKWDSIGPVDLTNFSSSRINVGWEWRGVSLKDFSGKGGSAERVLYEVFRELSGNRKHVIKAGYGDMTALPFEAFGGTDVYVSLPQLTAKEIMTEARRGKVRQVGYLARAIPRHDESRIVFQQIFMEGSDGAVRFRRNRAGALEVQPVGAPQTTAIAPVH